MRGILRFGALWAFGSGAACGNVSDKPDAAMPDAAIDAALPSPTLYRWIIDKQQLPKSNPEAIMYGLDLNGDQVVDNQLGAVFAAFTAQGLDMQAASDTAIARGTILMLAEASVGGAVANAATFTMYTGANAQPPACSGPTDTVCRRHLQGTGSFDLAATSAHDPPLAGSIANQTLIAGPGHLQVSLAFLGGTPRPLELIGARVRLQPVAANSLGQSVLAGAVPMAQIDTQIYPAIQQSASAQVAIDCTNMTPPACGCTAGSKGATYLSLFDTTPKDCKITIDEVSNNTLLKSLFAPDVTIEGQQALSLGFGITAVKATFTP